MSTVLRTMPDMLGRNDVLATDAEPKAWPCATHPSDHIPIGAILSWPGAPHVVNDSERTGWQQLDDSSDPWTVSPRRSKRIRQNRRKHTLRSHSYFLLPITMSQYGTTSNETAIFLFALLLPTPLAQTLATEMRHDA